MVDKSTLACGNNNCLGCAGQIITKGLAGQGCNLIVGYFHLQIRVKKPEPPRTARGRGVPLSDYSTIPDSVDPNLRDVFLTVRWPFMEKGTRKQFQIDRRWANMIVNRINQINSFNENFSVQFKEFSGKFKAKFKNIENKFKIKWKK